MKPLHFKTLVAFLRYGFILILALILFTFIGFLALNWKSFKASDEAGFSPSGIVMNGLYVSQLNEPLVEIPIRFDLNEAFTDTTITFDYKEGGGTIYRKKRIQMLQDGVWDTFLAKHYQEILAKYKAGQAVPRDTIIREIRMLKTKSKPMQAGVVYRSEDAEDRLNVELSSPQDVKGKVLIRMNPASNYWWLVLANYLKVLVPTLSFLLILWQLNKITQHFLKGQIFTVDNFRRLRLIGIFLLLNWGANAYYDGAMWAARTELGNFRFEYKVIKNGVKQAIPFNVSAGGTAVEMGTGFWTALLIIIFAEVFRRGVALQREQELTI